MQRPRTLRAFKTRMQTYGFHRIYRRFLEANRRVIADKATQARNAEFMKATMRLPNRVVDWMRHGPAA